MFQSIEIFKYMVYTCIYYMTIKISDKSIELKDDKVICFYKADITKFGNGAKIDCKKEYYEQGYKAIVVVCK